MNTHKRKSSGQHKKRTSKGSKRWLETPVDEATAESSTSNQSPRNEKIKIQSGQQPCTELQLTPTKSEFGHDSADQSNSDDETAGESLSNDGDNDLHMRLVKEFLDEEELDENISIVSSKTKLINEEEFVKEPYYLDPGLTADCYNVDNNIIFTLKDGNAVYLYGLCYLTVLHGTVQILGYEIDKSYGKVKLYSFRGSSFYYVLNTTKNSENNSLPEGLPANLKIENNSAVVLCEKLEESHILFMEKHISQKILPKIENNEKPRVIFTPKIPCDTLIVNLNWNSVIESVVDQTILIICGGKGLGKTTFLRYAINRLLKKFEKVQVVDLDPGQPEFTPPGCISLTTITEPIFGVNYSHLKTPDRSILCSINIADEPTKYLFNIKYLMQAYVSNVPTLVNTGGYSQGLALNLISSVIAAIGPTDILELHCKDPKKNFEYPLSADIIEEHAKLLIPDVICRLNYRLHRVFSMHDAKSEGWTAQPRQLRESLILAYFGKVLKASNSILDTKLYEHKLSAVKLCDSRGKKVSPKAVNANLVALCTVVKRERQIFYCHGWGIVRGVDVPTDRLVLITPEKFESLSRITCLVLTDVTLPPSLYMTPEGAVGQIPYVCTGVLQYFGQIPKRSKLPANKK